MSRTVTLLQLRTDIANAVDVTVGTTTRYTPAYLNRRINQSIQRFRERVSSEAMAHFLVPTTGTLTPGATAPYSFGEVDLSSVSPSVVRTYGFDITVNSEVISLAHRPFTERNDRGSPTSTGIPIAWMHYQTRKVALSPAPNAAYAYTVWYLPVLADLSDDADTFDGVSGWEDYVLADVALQIIARDQYPNAYALFAQQLEATWRDILRGASKFTAAGGANVGRDTFGHAGMGVGRQRGPVMAGGGQPGPHSVTNAMLAEMPEETLHGRARGAGRGDVTNLTPGQVAGVTSVFSGFAAGLVPTGSGNSNLFLANDGAWRTVSAAGSVSGLALSQLQDLASPRVVGRFSGGTGAPEQLLGQQVASMMGVFTGTAHGLVPYPSGGAAGLFLKDNATWGTPAGGAGTGLSNAMLLDMPPFTFKGRNSGASGVPQDLTMGQAASMLPHFFQTGTSRGLVVAPTGGVQGLFLGDNGAWQGVPSTIPTGIGLSQLLAIPETTILGRTSPSGIPQALTPSTVATMMPVFNDLHKGLVPPGSAGDATKFLSGAGTWATPAGGGGGPTMLAAGPANSVQYNGGSGFAGATGFRFGTASGLHLEHGINMATGTLRMGVSPASAGLWRVSNNPGVVVGYRAYDGTARQMVGLSGDGSTFDDQRFGDSDPTSGNYTTYLGAKGQVVAQVAGEAKLTVTTSDVLVGSGMAIRWEPGAAGRISVGGVAALRFPGANQLVVGDGQRIAIPQLSHSAATDKLATWTPSGFANIATGLSIGASGYQLSVGSGGPVLHASGIQMRSGDMEGVRRINGLDGIKLYGFVTGGGAASGTIDIVAPSGTAFVIPESVTTGQVIGMLPTGAIHGDTVLLENRSGISHLVNNCGTGMGVPSAFIATLPASGGISLRFGSGAWEYGNRYKLGGF